MFNKKQNRKAQAGPQKNNEPRLLGSIISEMLHGDSPLAVGYRKYLECNQGYYVRNDED